MTKTTLKTSAPSKSILNSPIRSSDAPDANHALVNLRAWHQKLVARGDRIVERAVREREALAIRNAVAGPTDTTPS